MSRNSASPTKGLDLLTADQESLKLVAALLTQEIQSIQDARIAQQLQLSLMRKPSMGSRTPCISELGKLDDDGKDDELFSLQQQLDCINSTLSKGKIASMVGTERVNLADTIRARQLNQQFEATTKKEKLDHEFAKALQESDRIGRDSDQVARAGLEAVLGRDFVRNLMATPPSLQPSGGASSVRAPATIPKFKFSTGGAAAPSASTSTYDSTTSTAALPSCLICFEPVTVTPDSRSASLLSTSSNRITYGTYLGSKFDGHVCCIECLGAYIKNRLEDGTGKAFPMKCVEPDCRYVLTDEDAKLGLGEANLESWHYRKLLDSQPSLFCPNRSCSARIVPEGDRKGDPQAECPHCHVLMCVPCKAVWHERYTCEQFQSLPPGERDPEDIAMFDVARREGYSRCPGCKALMELTEGCYHMTCPCGVESCYLCGLPWSRKPEERVGRCSRDPPCPLADEQQLLRPEFRNRDPALHAVAPQQAAAIPPAIPVEAQDIRPPAPAFDRAQAEQIARVRRFRALGFLDNWNGYCRNHFTSCLADNRCGYCGIRFRDLRQLRDHLADLPHPVFECCNALFRTLYDLNQHVDNSRANHSPHRWIVPGRY